MRGVDAVIHLACISNDPSFELDSCLSRTINYDCFEPLVDRAPRRRPALHLRFDVSVYGVSDAPDVTEEHPLVPLTDYNKYKGMCEPILLRYQSPGFTTVIIRPATVCGYSPRLRLDLTVNILTNHAVNKGAITVFGGEPEAPQYPHRRHHRTLRGSARHARRADRRQIFNAAYQNRTVAELGELVRASSPRDAGARPDPGRDLSEQ